MSLPIIASIGATILFGIVAVFLSIREEQAQRLALSDEKRHKLGLYEIAILKEIQHRLGYSLDIEKVIDVITGSLRNIISYSTSSILLFRDDKLLFKTYVEEGVNRSYIEHVKQIMLSSLKTLVEKDLPDTILESLNGVVLDDKNKADIASYFTIPVVLNDQIVGLITVTSTKHHLYKDEEMTTLYQITNQAAHALTKFQNVLTTEKEKLMAMIGSLADGVFMIDINSQLVAMNNASKQALQITKENPSIIDILSSMPKDIDFGTKIETVLNENKVIEEKEMHLGDKFFHVLITPVLNPHSSHDASNSYQHMLGVSVLMHDITLEKSLAQMKENFTHVIVHELRSPITAIKASSELMVGQDGKLSADEKIKLLQLIDDQSKKLLDEIGLILDAAKVESGLFKVQKTPGDLQKVITERVEFFKPQAQEKKVTLLADVQNIPETFFDSRYMGQVINNLLSNAFKFTPEGGKIVVSAKAENEHIIITVSDNGMGIPKEKQSMLFNKFAQVNTPNASMGTGLGLYIVKGIVEAHGGSIVLDSDSSKGTTFTITLPLEIADHDTIGDETSTTPLPTTINRPSIMVN